MKLPRVPLALAASWLLSIMSPCAAYEVSPIGPLAIGETFFIRSPTLGEDRRINVYFPQGFSAATTTPLPVMYMPDGGMAEDFLHIAGLIQVLAANKAMRPFVLVGIENTDRRRDLTTPTENAEDLDYAPNAGGSQAFRTFVRNELKAEIRKRYPVTDESALIGESLAGLFVVETFLLEPDLFDVYIAFDPSLWWNNQWLLQYAEASLKKQRRGGKAILIGTSSQPGMAEPAQRLVAALAACSKRCAEHHYFTLPDESHATLFHPAALRAFRQILAPAAAK